jgi:hypothetical protein
MEIIAPTLRSRAGQPSNLCPMPGEKELLTVEWQSAHWIPTDFKCPSESKIPLTFLMKKCSKSHSSISLVLLEAGINNSMHNIKNGSLFKEL